MKTVSLATYSMYSAQEMSESHTKGLRKLYKEFQNSNSRLLAPLLSLFYLNNTEVKGNNNLVKHLTNLRKNSQKVSEDYLLYYLEHSQDLELNKYAHSFVSENKRREGKEFKDNYRETFKVLQEQLHLSTYQLAKMSGVHYANFYGFYKGNDKKLSTKKCEDLLNKLVSMM